MHTPVYLSCLVVGVALGFGVCCVGAQSRSDKADWSSPENVIVDLVDYAFKPERLIFHRATPTRLRLINSSDSMHDFTAADFFKTVELRDAGVLASSGVGITVEPHQQRDVDFIARIAGPFGLICADHDWAGMTGDIVVE